MGKYTRKTIDMTTRICFAQLDENNKPILDESGKMTITHKDLVQRIPIERYNAWVAAGRPRELYLQLLSKRQWATQFREVRKSNWIGDGWIGEKPEGL